MGAIWNFISGKSTDWKEVSTKQAAKAEKLRRYRENNPTINYKAVCEFCGAYSSVHKNPEDAIKQMESYTGGCGTNNHVATLIEVQR